MQPSINKQYLKEIADKVCEYLKIPKIEVHILKYNQPTYVAYAVIERKQINCCPDILGDEMHATAVVAHECCHFKSIYHTKRFREIERDVLKNLFNYKIVSYKKSSNNILYVNRLKTRLSNGEIREITFYIP